MPTGSWRHSWPEPLRALRDNDEPHADAGIETTYNFASPANRRNTGPLERFVRMVKSPRYRPMIDHEEAVAGPVERTGQTASRLVTITGPEGRTVTYEWGLSVARTGRFRGCWTADSVVID
ncbi:DUF4864 domain-containing protein [Halobacteriales archaeon SW_7_68_16]|nr:MAG: DUF4864 domain-containing protein [Halobacteriales archaeon SW_7_68_16]